MWKHLLLPELAARQPDQWQARAGMIKYIFFAFSRQIHMLTDTQTHTNIHSLIKDQLKGLTSAASWARSVMQWLVFAQSDCSSWQPKAPPPVRASILYAAMAPLTFTWPLHQQRSSDVWWQDVSACATCVSSHTHTHTHTRTSFLCKWPQFSL